MSQACMNRQDKGPSWR